MLAEAQEKLKILNEFDLMPGCCKQLIVWNPDNEEIIGGYRYVFGADWKIWKRRTTYSCYQHMFHFSDKFLKEYAPYTVELGRSFVSLGYQNVRENSKKYFRSR